MGRVLGWGRQVEKAGCSGVKVGGAVRGVGASGWRGEALLTNTTWITWQEGAIFLGLVTTLSVGGGHGGRQAQGTINCHRSPQVGYGREC